MTGSVSLKKYLTYLSTNFLHSSYLMHILMYLMSILTKWRWESNIWLFSSYENGPGFSFYWQFIICVFFYWILVSINVLNGLDIFSLIPIEVFHNCLKTKKLFQYQWPVIEFKYELIFKSIAKCTDLQIH